MQWIACADCIKNFQTTFHLKVTTHSRLLSKANLRAIASAAGFAVQCTRCVNLHEFHTEQQFTEALE